VAAETAPVISCSDSGCETPDPALIVTSPPPTSRAQGFRPAGRVIGRQRTLWADGVRCQRHASLRAVIADRFASSRLTSSTPEPARCPARGTQPWPSKNSHRSSAAAVRRAARHVGRFVAARSMPLHPRTSGPGFACVCRPPGVANFLDASPWSALDKTATQGSNPAATNAGRSKTGATSR
jgi:hypothetical protein